MPTRVDQYGNTLDENGLPIVGPNGGPIVHPPQINNNTNVNTNNAPTSGVTQTTLMQGPQLNSGDAAIIVALIVVVGVAMRSGNFNKYALPLVVVIIIVVGGLYIKWKKSKQPKSFDEIPM